MTLKIAKIIIAKIEIAKIEIAKIEIPCQNKNTWPK